MGVLDFSFWLLAKARTGDSRFLAALGRTGKKGRGKDKGKDKGKGKGKGNYRGPSLRSG